MSLSFRKASIADWETIIFLEKSSSSRLFFAYTKKDETKKYLAKSQVYIIENSGKPIWDYFFRNKGQGPCLF
ncbi:MAG: hypothetical protein UX80_C0004G0038 [Candidatus Amesbacteria bacterium GW2011_GWA2_47_11b]|uniref:N-acetyltransferase domain-containing protein n=3 Tax=Candidatus Amesiibacteriota TaxID=1752730 RepID=A0A0G1SHN0_9BACT|nr:MAG: hypothetical protein UX42_C0001G0014 [Microgenomates group bacterium GW2011_GWC1_46_20]KKU58287.1 MAG: hypothetical protein UX80_C0004G0038 [Candidatus Amesbacteria bacterium GW2011_GWA2_47_11b]KKU68926.1 MAG: hypothetical protein UX92_C0017G0033 [Candidatus Amesbacteria bacterium GW2011_GWA1_47_20]KKU83141.1 MAG: hypothetical protein UY11_C0027G0009 [Candidatus Amesbacteria bacterium GW2011_GWC2_47_8]